jgi:hypothetical protein
MRPVNGSVVRSEFLGDDLDEERPVVADAWLETLSGTSPWKSHGCAVLPTRSSAMVTPPRSSFACIERLTLITDAALTLFLRPEALTPTPLMRSFMIR